MSEEKKAAFEVLVNFVVSVCLEIVFHGCVSYILCAAFEYEWSWKIAWGMWAIGLFIRHSTYRSGRKNKDT